VGAEGEEDWSEARVNDYLAAAALASHSPRQQLGVLDSVALAACERFARQEVGAAEAWLLAASAGVGAGGAAGSAPRPYMPALIEAAFSVIVPSSDSPSRWYPQYAGQRVRVAGVIDRVDVVLNEAGQPYLRVREFKSSQQWKKKGPSGKSPLSIMMARGIQSNLYGIAMNAMRASEGWSTELAPPPLSTTVSAAAAADSPPPRRRSAAAAKERGVDDVLVALEGIETLMVEERVIGEREREVAVARTLDSARDIAEGKFPPTPGEHTCTYCSYSSMCPSAFGKVAAVTVHRLEAAKNKKSAELNI